MRNGQIFTRVYRACFCLVLSLVAAAASAQEPETHNTSAPPADTTPTPVPSPKPPPFTVVPQDQDWRQSLRDGVYSVPGDLLRTGRLSRARFIGHQPGVGIDWFADRHTTFSVEFGRFLVGPFLRETPPGENTTYFAAWMTYRF